MRWLCSCHCNVFTSLFHRHRDGDLSTTSALFSSPQFRSATGSSAIPCLTDARAPSTQSHPPPSAMHLLRAKPAHRRVWGRRASLATLRRWVVFPRSCRLQPRLPQQGVCVHQPHAPTSSRPLAAAAGPTAWKKSGMVFLLRQVLFVAWKPLGFLPQKCLFTPFAHVRSSVWRDFLYVDPLSHEVQMSSPVCLWCCFNLGHGCSQP